MASYFAYSFSRSLHRDLAVKSTLSSRSLLLSSSSQCAAPYNSIVFEAARLLGPPASFEASKLKVILREDLNKCSRITPRTYVLSHCDRTANLTLTVSSIINLDQLKGWYDKDDVLVEWKKVMGEMCLHVHCRVSGPDLLLDLAAEFRYHIFCKELPLVLKAILYGDPVLFKKHPELTDALVRVYFHSSSCNYNRVESWGSLKHAAQGSSGGGEGHGLYNERDEGSLPSERWGMLKSFFRELVTFLL